MTLADKIIPFLFNLQFPKVPKEIIVLNPFDEPETRRVCTDFYQSYYNDNLPRYCIIGINPGRFGAGITGVPFTDPIRLETKLHIKNDWQKKQELSSVFVYEMIDAFGGPHHFYQQFYITAVSPLGFVKDGKNLNYYDNNPLQESVIPFALDCFRKQVQWGLHTNVAFCLGEGKNYKFINNLNKEHRFFDDIIPLPHPRFIMQYKLKTKEEYIHKYLSAFDSVTGA
jgi:hypothetical protein